MPPAFASQMLFKIVCDPLLKLRLSHTLGPYESGRGSEGSSSVAEQNTRRVLARAGSPRPIAHAPEGCRTDPTAETPEAAVPDPSQGPSESTKWAFPSNQCYTFCTGPVKIYFLFLLLGVMGVIRLSPLSCR